MRKVGMGSFTFFFDSYALFEIIGGNPRYGPYQDASIITAIFNLAELNYGLKKEVDHVKADEFTRKFSSSLVEVTVDDVTKAMSLRFKKKDLSIPDAIGYTVAQRLNVRFLTGDDDFKDMPNVEFVKK